MALAKKAAAFEELLGRDEVDIHRLAELCIEGIPDSPKSLRPHCWRLLLDYVPCRRSERRSTLKKSRREYYRFVNDLLVDPFIEATRDTQHTQKSASTKGRKGKKTAVSARVEVDANPLLNDPKYTSYFADNQTLEQIDKDVRRTLADIAFFQQPVPVSHLSPLSPHMQPKLSLDMSRPSIDMTLDKPALAPLVEGEQDESSEPVIKTRRTIFARIKTLNKDFGSHQRSPRPSSEAGRIMANRSSLDENDIEDLHWESIERILFVYAKLNPGLGYVQGMNELLAPLYFVLAQDDDSDFRAHSEADTFYCFVSLMSEARDLFERTHDHDQSDDAGRGINAVLSRFMDRLQFLDAELHDSMTNQQIEPTYFAFRWFCCMLSQDFSLPDVIRIWDSIFADRADVNPLRVGYLTDFCCALLINVREKLLYQAFADNIKLLQHYPQQDIGPVLSLTLQLRGRQPTSNNNSSSKKFNPIAGLKLPTFASTTHPAAAESPFKSKQGTFSSLKSLSTFLSPRSSQAHQEQDTAPEVLHESGPTPRQSTDMSDSSLSNLAPPHHAPPLDDPSQRPSRLSYEFTRPQFPTLPRAWFNSSRTDTNLLLDTVGNGGTGRGVQRQSLRGTEAFEDEDEDAIGGGGGRGSTTQHMMSADGDSRLGALRARGTSLFRRAGAFVANTHTIPASSPSLSSVSPGPTSDVARPP